MPNKKISDKERLDWMLNGGLCRRWLSGWISATENQTFTGKTGRQTIDYAIKAERASKPKKGGKR